MNLLSVISFTAFIIYIQVGLNVRGNDPKAKVNKLFFALGIIMALWSFASTFLYSGNHDNWVYGIEDTGILMFPAVVLHLSAAVTHYEKRLSIKWALLFLYVSGMIFAIADSYNLITNVFPEYSYHMWNIAIILQYTSGACSLFLVQSWHKNTPLLREKRQAGLIRVCGLVTIVLASVDSFLIPRKLEDPNLFHLIFLIFISGVWYAVKKYKFLSVESLVTVKDIANKVIDMVILLDDKGKIIDTNYRVKEMLGYENKELQGQPFGMLLDKESEAELSGKDMEELQGNNSEVFCRTKTGGYIPVKVHSSTVLDKGKDTVGYVVVCQDKSLVLELQKEITERKFKEQQLDYLSLHDPLTGLYNRTHFERELINLKNRLNSVGIIICDIDGLKFVNDTLGHEAGDKLLIAAAGAITSAVYANDIITARIGGDEFALIVPYSEDVMVDICGRINKLVNEYNRSNPDSHLSISVGHALGSPSQCNMTDLFKEADNNMYKEKLSHSQSVRSSMIQALTNALAAKDFITEGHAARMKDLVTKLGMSMDLPDSKIFELQLLAQFHDIGKVSISDSILFKPSSLSAKEREEMQRHCEIGYRIACALPDLYPIADFILKHHERWDGKGYPLGLKGEQIPIECRLISVVDAFDAMTNYRPYREAMLVKDAVSELERCAGKHFDPEIVQAFIKMLGN